MKLEIDREKILPTLSLVSGVVERKQTLPILGHLCFDMHKGKLMIVGTDVDIEVSDPIDGLDGDEGAFTVSMQKIYDLVRLLPEKAVIAFQYDSDKGQVVVTSGRSRYTLKTLNPGEFPRITAADWQERFQIGQVTLRNLLQKTAFAMAVHDVRYYLNGVLFRLSSDKLYAIATDGHRLAQSYEDVSLELSEDREIIVPRKAIAEIKRFLGIDDDAGRGDGGESADGSADGGDDHAEVTVEINPTHLKLSKPGTVLITTLIDGKFPEFKQVLETEMKVEVDINRLEFIDVLTRAAVLTTDDSGFRGVKLHLEDNVLRVTASNREHEEAVEEMAVVYDGEAVESGYNVSYLQDVARASDSEQLELHLQGNDGLSIVREPGDERTIWLTMPMRI